MRRLLVMSLLLCAGCNRQVIQVKVLHSDTEIQQKVFTFQDGDVLVCDSQKCRELTK